MVAFLKNITLFLLVAGIVATITIMALIYLETMDDREISQAIQAALMSGGGD